MAKKKKKVVKKDKVVKVIETNKKKFVQNSDGQKKFEYREYKVKGEKLTEELVKEISEDISKTKDEVERFFFGNRPVIDSLMRALICNG